LYTTGSHCGKVAALLSLVAVVLPACILSDKSQFRSASEQSIHVPQDLELLLLPGVVNPPREER
jgi:hypothetical protein